MRDGYIGAVRKERKELYRIDQLDKKAETTVLQQHEVDLQNCLKERLTTLLRGGNKIATQNISSW
jgi:hypothetical protein